MEKAFFDISQHIFPIERNYSSGSHKMLPLNLFAERIHKRPDEDDNLFILKAYQNPGNTHNMVVRNLPCVCSLRVKSA
jgi:hypothetical protein